VRYFRADRRNIGLEAAPAADDQPQPWQQAVSREPTPEHAAVLAETVEQMLREVTPAERPVIELSLQGYSTQEVSQQLGRAERSVRRLRERMKKQLERQQAMDLPS
jgi:RNA polymerase sigma-70 factor (ECF subfamily)